MLYTVGFFSVPKRPDGCGTHPTSYSMGTEFVPGDEAAGSPRTFI